MITASWSCMWVRVFVCMCSHVSSGRTQHVGGGGEYYHREFSSAENDFEGLCSQFSQGWCIANTVLDTREVS